MFVISLPVLVFVKLCMLPFERPVEKSRDEVLGVLRGFVDGTCNDENWDEFICVPIKDAYLDNIRKQAIEIDELGTAEAKNGLRVLLSELDRTGDGDQGA